MKISNNIHSIEIIGELHREFTRLRKLPGECVVVVSYISGENILKKFSPQAHIAHTRATVISNYVAKILLHGVMFDLPNPELSHSNGI